MLYTPDKPIWHTDTKGAKDVRLILQDDRNVVVYGFDGVAWASGTNTDEAPPPPAGAEEAAPEVAPAAAEEPLPPAEAPAPHRRRLRRRRLRHPHLAPTQWFPVTRCGRSRNASTATAASISGSPTPVASATPT